VTLGPPAAPELYETGAYAPGAPRLSAAVAPLLRMFDRQRLRFVARACPAPARLVDAGAGRGRFVAHARAAGYDAIGLEPSRRGVEAARSRGIELLEETIETATLPSRSVDAVTLWHVLEHLDEPGPALDRIASWLSPQGVVVVGVPNLGSLQARIGGPRWFHLDLPRHRTHFTVAGLHALLREHALEPVATHHVLAEHNPFGMWQSLVNRVTRAPSYLYNLLKRNASPWSPDLAVTALAAPLLPVAATLEVLAGVARAGGTVAVVARRA
jgi:SAM-dependent methyltransferase